MCVSLHMKFQVSSIILTNLRLGIIIGLNFLLDSMSAVILSNTINALLSFVGL